MMARDYTASLDLDQLHEQSEHLAHALYLFFEAGTKDTGIFTPDRCIACRHFAWQLLQHVKRLSGEYDETYGSQPEGSE